MNAQRLILLLGAVVLIAGVIALIVPVSITGDGQSIGCGNAVAADSSEADTANGKTVANVPILNQIVPHTDYVAECATRPSRAAGPGPSRWRWSASWCWPVLFSCRERGLFRKSHFRAVLEHVGKFP